MGNIDLVSGSDWRMWKLEHAAKPVLFLIPVFPSYILSLTRGTLSDTPAVAYLPTSFISYSVTHVRPSTLAKPKLLLTFRINSHRYSSKSQLPHLPIPEHTSCRGCTFDETFRVRILKVLNLASPATVRKRWEQMYISIRQP